MNSSPDLGLFQRNISKNLPVEICFYILQFCDKSELTNVCRYMSNNKLELHSKILLKVYPSWRLVSKYYDFLENNSSCRFCKGRYQHSKRCIICNNCGYVNDLKYYHQDWKTVFEHRKTQHDNFIYNNLEFTLQDGS